MNKAWPDFPRRGALRPPSFDSEGCPPTSLGLYIISTKGRDAPQKPVPQRALARRPPSQHPNTTTTAMNLHRDEYWSDNIMHKPPSAPLQRSVDRQNQGPAAVESNVLGRPGGSRQSQQSTSTDSLLWPEDAFATRSHDDNWAGDLETFRDRVEGPALGKGRKDKNLASSLNKPKKLSVETRPSSQATDASGSSVRPGSLRRSPVRSVSMDSIQSSIRSPGAPSRRVMVVPVHQRGSPMPSTPTRQKRRPMCLKPQEMTWSRFGSDPPGDSADERFEHDIGFASETSRTATTVTATQASSSHGTLTYHGVSPRTPQRSPSTMSASRSPTLTVPSLSAPNAHRSRLQRTPSGSRARISAAGSPRRKSIGSSSSSSRRSSTGSNAFSISEKGGEDDDAVFSRISFENLGQYFLFPADEPLRRSNESFHSPTPASKRTPSWRSANWIGQDAVGNESSPDFGCFDDPLFPESATSLTRQDSTEDLLATQTTPSSSLRRPGTKRTNTPRRSAPRNLVTEVENAATKPETGVSPLPFPVAMPPTIISDQARIPYHRSMAKRLKDRQEEERAQLLSQIRSRSALPTCTARPPTPPRQRRYGNAGAGAAPGPSLVASPRRSPSSSRPQVRGGGRRKQITKPPTDPPDRAASAHRQDPVQQDSRQTHPGRTTDIFGDHVDQLNAFDDSFSERITWARFHK